MEITLLNKISNLEFCGYYDPSKNRVSVHFFNQQEEKPDIIAFLNRDMSWDIREIISETSVLYDNKEIITVEHMSIGTHLKDSDFDKFVRVGLAGMAKKIHGDVDLEQKDKMFVILNNGYKEDN